ncbi:hypothetical protein CPLU01_01151 [Colletotrichum plurivorum]|uniref:Uncharacterized protein n=1 Tax=Colletotrichum plurivorum TaxID=2175906 RepID=A0A8H6U5A3_9PEZI|nr:hypothetical protein CPLU01_01151 [Colletotrichum plurivorum]
MVAKASAEVLPYMVVHTRNCYYMRYHVRYRVRVNSDDSATANPPSLLLRFAMWLMEPAWGHETGKPRLNRTRVILAQLLLRMRLHAAQLTPSSPLQF